MNKAETYSGLVLVAKKKGITSFNSLAHIKKTLHTKKVGHTGTLDSFAEGLLVVAVGYCTKFVSHITAFDKTYRATLVFGRETDTLDPTGTVVYSAPLPTETVLRAVFELFKGVLEQVPPAYSAVHVQGKRASDLARAGKKVELSARKIRVYSSKILSIDFLDDESCGAEKLVRSCSVEFTVSKGCYIRSLARDIGRACNSAAHLTSLLRTQVGSFLLNEAVSYDDTSFSCIPLDKNLLQRLNIPLLHLNSAYEQNFFSGQKLHSAFFSLDLDSFKNYTCTDTKSAPVFCECAVFTDDFHCAGMVRGIVRYLENEPKSALQKNVEFEAQSYCFVIPR